MSRERRIVTPEHVPIVLVPAGAGSRFVALAIDTCISAALISVLVASLNGLLPRGIGAAAGIALAFAIHWGYHVYFETRHQGRTPGKRAAGLRVIDGRGLPITVEQSFLRNIVRALDFLPLFYGLGGLCALLDRDHRRLGDILADTLVVRDRSSDRTAAARAAVLQGALPHPNALGDPATLRRIRHRVSLPERELLLDLCLRADALEAGASYDLMEQVGTFYRHKLAIDQPQLSSENLVRDLTAAAFGVAGEP
jgi:uncharacterized RDD family membrane protein YckC